MKTPWYERTGKESPKGPVLIEEGLEKLATYAMDTDNFKHVGSNLDSRSIQAIKEIKQWPEKYNVVLGESDKVECYVISPSEAHSDQILKHLNLEVIRE